MKLFRAMSALEWQEVQSCGEFRPGPPSYQGKWFAEFLDDAQVWGQRLYSTTSSGFVIVEVSVPQAIADLFFSLPMLDGIGPARFVDVDQLGHLMGLPVRLVRVVP